MLSFDSNSQIACAIRKENKNNNINKRALCVHTLYKKKNEIKVSVWKLELNEVQKNKNIQPSWLWRYVLHSVCSEVTLKFNEKIRK